MSPPVWNAFTAILANLPPPTRVLEVGAVQGQTLLDLAPGASERVGINTDRHECGGLVSFGTGWDLPWPARRFDLVLCNSVLEHDARFWLTVGEMQRVLKPGGHLVIGVPGFAEGQSRILGVHRYPKDYYRFGEDAVREVFFRGMDLKGLQVVIPEEPRFVAWGTKRG